MRGLAMIVAAAAMLTGCAEQPRQLFVDRAWVRLSPVPGRPAAAYFTVHGGPAPAQLITVATDVAIRAEIHETTGGGMRAIRSVDIPANAVVAFKPGGRHVMLYDVNPGIKPGSTMRFTFAFANGLRLIQDAAVVGAASTPSS